MVYQPILDLVTGEVLGAEALARFGTEPHRSPAQWFVEAAEVGLGIQLELAALRRAAEGLPLLPPDAFLSVNLSPADPPLTRPRPGPGRAARPAVW